MCRRSLFRAFVLVALGCAASSVTLAATPLVRAGNGAVVGPMLLTDNDGSPQLALLEISGDPLKLSGERLFQAGFDAKPAPTGFIEVMPDGDGLHHPYAPFVYYDRPDCVGQPFVSLASTKPDVDLRAAIVGPRSDLYLLDDIGAHLYQVASRRYRDACTDFVFVIRAFPATNMGSLADRFPPPYAVSAAP